MFVGIFGPGASHLEPHVTSWIILSLRKVGLLSEQVSLLNYLEDNILISSLAFSKIYYLLKFWDLLL